MVLPRRRGLALHRGHRRGAGLDQVLGQQIAQERRKWPCTVRGSYDLRLRHELGVDEFAGTVGNSLPVY